MKSNKTESKKEEKLIGSAVKSPVALREEAILKFWEENNIFEKSLEKRKDSPLYSFYDGPPFATGTPHYGHIVASTMKDVVPRYWAMRGFRVDRKWGWDCHGLPIENIAEKELGITHKKEIVKMGVEKFNEFCRSKVLKYVDEWKVVIKRLGRWADMENSYKTMDLGFMESVWWVFKELWDKGMIYEGYRSMHICTRCETTLSQTEVAEGYKMIKDLSATAKFKLDAGQKIGDFMTDDNTYILAWTTTPWTLIGNVALAVSPTEKYMRLKIGYSESPTLKEGDSYIFAAALKDRIFGVMKTPIDGGRNTPKFEDLLNKDEGFKNVFNKYKGYLAVYQHPNGSFGANIIGAKQVWILEGEIFEGKDLEGKEYKPLFDFYLHKGLQNEENGWKIYAGDFVTTEEGTGIVHIAPAFGEDDMKLGQKYALPFIQHVGMDGIIRKEAGGFAGTDLRLRAKNKETEIREADLKIVKFLGEKIFHSEKYEHSYPHCWRCDTPLINYATSSWFVNVLKVKSRALELAKEINWSPEYIKEGRFGKWLEGARDWSISRQRFWASVIPIWKCSSSAERRTLNAKRRITDQDSKICDNVKVIGSVRELEELSGQKITDLHKHIVDEVTFKCAKCQGEMRRVPDVLDTWFDSGSMPYAQMHYPFENKEKFDPSNSSGQASFPADFIAEGVDQTRAWFYYLHVIATAIKNKPAFKNVIVNGIVLAEDGKKMSKRLKNYPDPTLMFDKYGADALRFYLLSSPVVSAETINFKESDVAELARGMFRMLWNSYVFFQTYAGKNAKRQTLNSENLLDKWILSELNILTMHINNGMEKYELVKTVRAFPKFIDNFSNWYIRRSRDRFAKPENDPDRISAEETTHNVLITLAKLLAPFTPFIAEEIYKNLTNEESVHFCDYPKVDEKLIDEKLSGEMDVVRYIVNAGLSVRAEKKIKVRQPLASITIPEVNLQEELKDLIKDELNVKEVKVGKKVPSLKSWKGEDYVPKMDNVELDTKITDELKEEGIVRDIARHIQTMRKDLGLTKDDLIEIYVEKKENIAKILGDAKWEKFIKEKTITKNISDFEEGEKYDMEKALEVEGEKIKFGIKKIV